MGSGLDLTDIYALGADIQRDLLKGEDESLDIYRRETLLATIYSGFYWEELDPRATQGKKIIKLVVWENEQVNDLQRFLRESTSIGLRGQLFKIIDKPVTINASRKWQFMIQPTGA